MKHFRYYIVCSVSCIAAVMFAAWIGFLQTYYTNPLIPHNESPIMYDYKPGTSSQQLTKELSELNIIHHPRLFWLVLLFTNNFRHLQAGEYLFPPGTTLASLVDQLTHGKVAQYPIIFIEGWTFAQLIEHLETNASLKHIITLPILEQLPEKLSLPTSSLEGWFYPDTYYFVKNTSDLSILQRAYLRMRQQLLLAWQHRAPDLNYRDAYSALIVASLIEKETANVQEKPMIAAVILNRLNLKMPLQIDASVIYGLGDRYQNALTKEDLLIDTPYNTYLHHGLPPTPIAYPSKSSLNAALHPATTTALYYVAKGDGTHQFSETLEQHHDAVARYQPPNTMGGM